MGITQGLDMGGLPTSPIGRYPIPTPPMVTLDVLSSSEKSVGRSSMRNKMIALPQGTLSGAQKEPSGPVKVGTAPFSASLQSESTDVFNQRDLLGQGLVYGDVECGATKPPSDHRDGTPNPNPPHFIKTRISAVKLGDSNNDNFEAYERCERKEVHLDNVEDPKTYRDDEVRKNHETCASIALPNSNEEQDIDRYIS